MPTIGGLVPLWTLQKRQMYYKLLSLRKFALFFLVSSFIMIRLQRIHNIGFL